MIQVQSHQKQTGLFTIDALIEADFATFRQAFSYLLLPAIVLAIYAVGIITRFTRASVLEILGNDYVRSARAKGLPEYIVIKRHVLRPALLSIITVAGVSFASLMAGSVLVENVFLGPVLVNMHIVQQWDLICQELWVLAW